MRASRDCADRPDQVTVRLADGTKLAGDVLIGAGRHPLDGARAAFREGTAPLHRNMSPWRGLVPAERVAHLDLGRVTGVWMGPNRSIVQYFVAAGRTFNWIGISRSEQPARESWLAEGRIEDALAGAFGLE
ncbi:hypothetical protein [Bradyrhizobium sp. RDI18]|uniref:hypothetical protein n=1 Tax=Bradyrhizobium sp. RDI18 TaxID=3367400 RepID=UPI003714BD30